MPEYITAALKESGLAGAVIGLLLMAIGVLWRHNSQVTKYRLAERDTLSAALTGAAKAIDKISEVTEDRNEVTKELSDAIEDMGNKFERLLDRTSMQYETLKDKSQEQNLVVASLSEAVRVNSGIVTGIRDFITSLPPQRGRSR